MNQVPITKIAGIRLRWIARMLACAVLFMVGRHACGLNHAAVQTHERPPNIVLIMTDDQGYGDVGWHGQTVLRTPHLDRLRREGVELTRFYVSPVCSLTRASLLTGRYSYRTRVVDTYIGRAQMDPGEATLAEVLGRAGYRCGIFGKWHLGDNAPLRARDQGFHTSLLHRGGGIGQPSDPPGGNSYFDPVLFRDDQPVKTKGFCSDVFTDAALEFIEANREGPFFAYLAFNAPHVPLEAPAELLKSYLAQLNEIERPQTDAERRRVETTARVYAMIANIDSNVGRVVAKLQELDLDRRTLVIFLTDNGPQQPRFNAGLRGLKGSVYEGGIRVPFVARLPGRLPEGRVVNVPAAHIDLLPTVLEACGVQPGQEPPLDGRSVWPLCTGAAEGLPERLLFVQWHRGDVPVAERAFAVMGERWKLVQAQGVAEHEPYEPKFELYDLIDDPSEARDLASTHPEQVELLRKAYMDWFADVCATRGFDPPRIELGGARENPSVLTRQDWRGPRAGWAANSLGHWEVTVVEAGTYRIDALLAPLEVEARARLRLGGVDRVEPIPSRARDVHFRDVSLPEGQTRLELEILPAGQAESVGPTFVRVERIDKSRRP